MASGSSWRQIRQFCLFTQLLAKNDYVHGRKARCQDCDANNVQANELLKVPEQTNDF
ncbi:hypothetical protein HUJ04_003783 [Dendroctonus ponderosae]|nr:hypothetical protein HUJ04_003783 [Dendroctonus ponderosae]